MKKETHTSETVYFDKIKWLAKTYDIKFIVQFGDWYKVVHPNGNMVNLPFWADAYSSDESTLKFMPSLSANAHLDFADYSDRRFALPMRIETVDGISLSVGNDYIKPDTPVRIRVTRPQDAMGHIETIRFKELRRELVDELMYIVGGQLKLNVKVEDAFSPLNMDALTDTYAMVLSRNEFLKTSITKGIDLTELA